VAVRVWRVARAARARTGAEAFDGSGGLHGPGRWHSTGRRIVHTARSESLAKLETLAHFRPNEAPALVLVEATIPDDTIVRVNVPLPAGWDAVPESDVSRAIGDAWLDEGSALCLEVPSVHSRTEMNILVNPAHAAFHRIVIAAPVPFAFDLRLIEPSRR
jgi:RES domain-containing protein